MFHGTYDRAERADRYRKVAAEYTGLSEVTPDQFLRSFYLRIAKCQDSSKPAAVHLTKENNYASV